MKIIKLEIKDFRLFEILSLDITGIQSIVGQNGGGKTSILEAIHYATYRYGLSNKINDNDFCINCDENKFSIHVEFDGCFMVNIPNGFQSFDVPCKGVTLTVKRRDRKAPGKALNDGFVINHICIPMQYNNLQEIEDFLPDNVGDLNLFESINPFTEAGITGYIGKTSVTKTTPARNIKFDYRPLAVERADLKGFPSVFYFGKNREKQSHKGYSSTFQKVIDDLNWKYMKQLNTNYATEKARVGELRNSYYIDTIDAVTNTKDDLLMGPLRTKVGDFFGSSKYEDLSLDLISVKKPFENAFFVLRSDNHFDNIEIGGLGSGEAIMISYYLLKIVSELSREEVIFLIDEPELHLHPKAQQKLLSEFEINDTQIIYSTHSDILINLGNWQTIKRICKGKVYPNNETLNIQHGALPLSHHIQEMVKYYQDKSIFFRENNEIFFADMVLLVEGPIDKYGIPIIANLMDYDFSKATIISCNGKDKIPYYQMLCALFAIPYYTVFDLDGESELEGYNKLIIENSNGQVFYFEKSFEEELGVGANNPRKVSNCLSKINGISDVGEISTDNRLLIENINHRIATQD